jgi:HAD superfamily hydrolase (TIGR01662 family)
VLFDLDDTLLYSDVGSLESGFLRHYFALLTDYARSLADPQTFMTALLTATEAMQRDQNSDTTNEQAFAPVFAAHLGRPWQELKPIFDRFYEKRFPKLRVHTRSLPDARRAIRVCLDAGCRVAVATNPLFPARAIEHRLAWAGVDDMPFALVTTYENMHTSKPSPGYYREIAERLSVSPGECVMVGNDVQSDIEPAQAVGMHTFLADEWQTGDDSQVEPDGRGTLQDFISWIITKTNGEWQTAHRT